MFICFKKASSSLTSSSSSSSVTSQALIDLVRPRLIVSSKAFQVVFVNLVYNSALFLTFWWCSFLLHVAVNLICIFWVSRQIVLFSTLTEFLISFCGKMVYQFVLLKNFIAIDGNRVLIFFLKIQISLPFNTRRMGTASKFIYSIIENL
jgi:uncharacterized protein (DUF486 family)